VLDPLRVVIENYPEGEVEEVEVVNNPEDPAAGTRRVAFSRELYIERDDFMEEPPPKFFRLAPGREVRLRSAYFVTCTGVVRDASGRVVELRCTYDPATRGGDLFADLRPDSETIITGCLVEPSMADVPVGETVQFERLGYFCPDPDSAPGALVLNRTLTLKDTWAKVQARG
jgi:glutaminyl-tRNA synthetase